MERFTTENNAENEKVVSIVLGTEKAEKLAASFLGKSVEDISSELLKIYSILKHIKAKGLKTKEEIKLVVLDLLKEFNVKIIKYDTVFTNKVIDQILNSKGVDSVTLKFNEKPLIAESGSTIDSILEAWSKLSFSEVIKNKEADHEKEAVKQEQIVIDKMFTELDTFDFTNQEKLVDWLFEFYTHYIQGADMHKTELLEKFKSHGYVPEDNDAFDGMLGETLKDKKRLGRVLIGSLLMNGSLALRGNGFRNLIQSFKNY